MRCEPLCVTFISRRFTQNTIHVRRRKPYVSVITLSVSVCNPLVLNIRIQSIVHFFVFYVHQGATAMTTLGSSLGLATLTFIRHCSVDQFVTISSQHQPSAFHSSLDLRTDVLIDGVPVYDRRWSDRALWTCRADKSTWTSFSRRSLWSMDGTVVSWIGK